MTDPFSDPIEIRLKRAVERVRGTADPQTVSMGARIAEPIADLITAVRDAIPQMRSAEWEHWHLRGISSDPGYGEDSPELKTLVTALAALDEAANR